MHRKFTLLRDNDPMKGFAKSLLRDPGGVAMVEFAMVFPVLLFMGASGIELTNFFLANRRISDIAMQVSDNASRMGGQTTLANKPVSEKEINDVFMGAQMLSGGMDIGKNGRVMLSSVELNKDGGQTIKWQRCYGAKAAASKFGVQGDGASGNAMTSVAGLTARADTAVMLVQVNYTYNPAVSFVPYKFNEIVETAAFNVRDHRDLSKLYNVEGVPVSTCS
jgi:Flp pilus assembly protein TadG